MRKIAMQVTIFEDEDGFEVVPELADGYEPENLLDVFGQYLDAVAEELDPDPSPGWGKP